MHMRAVIVASKVPLALARNDKIDRIELENPPLAVADLVLSGQARPLPAGEAYCLAAVLGTKPSFGIWRQTDDFVERHALLGAAQPHADEVGYFHLVFDLPVERFGNQQPGAGLLVGAFDAACDIHRFADGREYFFSASAERADHCCAVMKADADPKIPII